MWWALSPDASTALSASWIVSKITSLKACGCIWCERLLFLFSSTPMLNVVYFPCLTGIAFRRLQLAFNACVRYIYRRRHFDHISDVATEILGCELFTYFTYSTAEYVSGISCLSLSGQAEVYPGSRERLSDTYSSLPRTHATSGAGIINTIKFINLILKISSLYY
jgi:hypothetical protein